MKTVGLELTAFDSLLLGEPKPLLVGGQAVSLWAQAFVVERPELQALRPFLSHDCDVLGDADTLERLAARGNWGVTFSKKGQASPVVGYLTGKDPQGRDLLVEVLYTIKGLRPRELEQEALVQMDQKTYRTLSPVLLLKAKLANYLELPQKTKGLERNDLKHLRILIPCVSAYLARAHAEVAGGRFTDRSLVNLLEQTLAVVSGVQAHTVVLQEGLDFRGVFPACLKHSALPKVLKFIEHRLEPWLAKGETPG